MDRRSRTRARDRAARRRSSVATKQTAVISALAVPTWPPLPGSPDPCAELRALGNALNDTTAAISAEVARLRSDGVAWPAIGDALGVTRQAARQRFGRGSAVGLD